MTRFVVITDKEAERFWSKVFIRGSDDCWEYDGGTISKEGVGRFHFRSQKIMAHRIAFAIEYGYIPEGDVTHTCGNRSCVNPAHLVIKNG